MFLKFCRSALYNNLMCLCWQATQSEPNRQQELVTEDVAEDAEQQGSATC